MNQATPEEEIVRGTIERITYKNPDNGYAVIQVTVADKRECLTVVGTLFEPSVGADVVVRGNYITHPKFGRQIQASSITKTVPTSQEGFEKYLSSGVIKGIGQKIAGKIVGHLGDRALEVIHRDPQALAKVPGLSKAKAQLIHETFASQENMGMVMQFLIEHKVSPRLSAKIYEKYRNKSVEVLSNDPYILSRTMKGVGFATADGIAMNLGLKMDSPQRLKAGLYYALEKASEDGHCFLTADELSRKARQLLSIDDELSLEEHLDSLIDEGYIINDGGNYYLKILYTAEEFVASFVGARLEPRESPILSEEDVRKVLAQASAELNVTFSPEQEHAVTLANNHRILLITGGPGCGKTTLIRALSIFFKKANFSLVLAAPTGRAAQRMTQVTSQTASTIHRLLKYDPGTTAFVHGLNQPLLADAVIIDEASMLDIVLAKDLFSAIGPDTALILVGDKDQLPSVGPGRVFAELLSAKEVKSISLTQIFRRAEESSINTIAHLINSGIDPNIPEPDGQVKSDAYFIPRKTAEETALLLEKLVADQIPKKFGFHTHEISILTPSNRGPLGTLALNALLQQRLNPSGALDAEQELTVNNQIFRVGDRVCQRVNNYNIDTHGVFNGDTGIIQFIDRANQTVQVELWDGRLITYENQEIHQLALAYSLTVHRAQGSESPCVVFVLDNAHYTLLERQLLYTAVTRAKKLLIITGTRSALAIAVKKASSTKRNTALRKKIALFTQ